MWKSVPVPCDSDEWAATKVKIGCDSAPEGARLRVSLSLCGLRRPEPRDPREELGT